MGTERRAEALLRGLAEEDVPAEDPAAAERRRRRVIAATGLAIAREAGQRARRRRWASIGGAFASAAAILALAGTVWRSRAALGPSGDDSAHPIARGESLVGTLHRTHRGAAMPAASGQLALGAGDEVTTESADRGEVVLADGVAIALAPATRVRLPDGASGVVTSGKQDREEVALFGGTVSVHVPPMPPGHTFSIKTPDAEVVVHGTSFTVEFGLPAASAAPRVSGMATKPATRVHVTTGVVSVASGGEEVLLTAGMEWASPAEPKGANVRPPAPLVATSPAAIPSVATGDAPTTPSGRGGGGEGSGRPPRRDGVSAVAANGPSNGRSSLGEENQLFAAAITASKAGDYSSAVAKLDNLLRRFPSSTLSQEVHVARFRALAHGSDRAAAAREARLYLALYPDGFAREEAKALAVGW